MKNEDDISIHIPKQVLVMTAAILLLTIGTIVAFESAKRRTPTIVLPGGITYLGPSPLAAPVPPADEWVTYQGKLFPYSFSYPKSLSLGVFPNDPFDSVTIYWGNTNPQENLLLRVEKRSPAATPIIEYARDWWKQYNWSGVKSVEQFKNSKGLTGYRAKYIDSTGKTPYDNIFFEVPGKPELVIWMSGKLLDQETFDRLIESVSWQL
ncbi:hypothetical protein A2875_02080 [Candidatus Gottesmanbacteria bacterium RIFCSPHIGHO2_01_FULL_46_14]|uniref:Uncharacterized protein n=2 Tax=Candidatus Gottesmaniibacteriota TaxID=1752720 RepID=A0A1F5ZQ66_9BACT|nr:MAG: hypothetical protein A2875_02080 [Candidatus Gottesmanbacteria bacterium RIFCSPHIGHO2_01_FULL_46_14]OGG29491.1 MAG: hypothetical protein A2971_02250 [Candidatus Gottesmanbacteria bacterium RIFCSPLOWO2_01_FULL_46_21]